MTTGGTTFAVALVLLAGAPAGMVPGRAVELVVSCDALQRTLKKQLFNGADGGRSLKGNPRSACYLDRDPHRLSSQEADHSGSKKSNTPTG